MNVRKNLFYNALLAVFNVLFPLVSFPYASRILGPDGVGISQFALTFTQYFVIVAALGIPVYGIREVAKYRSSKIELSKLFSELFFINAIASIGLFAVYLVLIFSVTFFAINTSLYFFCSANILLGFLNIDWLYSGLDEFKTIAVRSMIIKLISLAALFVFVKTPDDVLRYLIVLIFSIVGNQIWNTLLIKGKVTFVFRQLNFRKHMKPLFLIFATVLAINIYGMLDIVLLGFFSNNREVGLYSATVRIVRTIVPVITSLGTVLIPSMSIAIAQNEKSKFEEMANKFSHAISVFSIPAAVGTYIYAPEIIRVISGNNFIDAIPMMRMVAFVIVLSPFLSLYAMQVLMTSNKNREMLISILSGAVFSVVSNIVVIPFLGGLGSAICIVTTELLIIIIAYHFVKKDFAIKINAQTIFVSLLFSGSFVLIAYALRRVLSKDFIILAAGISASVIVYLLLQLFVAKDELVSGSLNKFLRIRNS
ncbi:flippase [Pinibacter soli]|uniref:Flippase n=1 Tax=Pinibacter soli TaxID=3044211 RepID=A0ABT6RCH2_9BACT|nr:flippase [Pinibacter soli]MDI3320261.1 flippase [Pinibacter soli]